MKENLPERKIIRLKQYNYNSVAYYFITFCVKDRLSLLGNIIENKLYLNKEGLIVKKYILDIQNRYSNTTIKRENNKRIKV